MLTYELTPNQNIPLYLQLTDRIKQDISDGILRPGEKLPSKRSFAANLGVSRITVETAYQQLTAEGYIYSLPRSGYYISDIRSFLPSPGEKEESVEAKKKGSETYSDPEGHPFLPAPAEKRSESSTGFRTDFSSNETSRESFPFTTWARLSREELSAEAGRLLTTSPGIGVYELREAVSRHLFSFRGIHCDPENIVIGAGTEYLYGLLIQLLGFSSVYGVEDPGYQKIPRIYRAHQVETRFLPTRVFNRGKEAIEEYHVDVLHISPSHHFPTGRVMPIRERNLLLDWVSCGEERYIIEDDYDSEFRLTGRPIPTLFETDPFGRVIYMNTFTKTLASTVRISVMVLPPALMQRYRTRLSFYSCTVSNFEQYTLARFIRDGHFERHLNRMRNYYRAKRDRILRIFDESPLAPLMKIHEEDSGLHFLLELKTTMSDKVFAESCRERGIRITPLSAYYHDGAAAPQHIFIVNYSSLSEDTLPASARVMAEILSSGSGTG